MHLYCYWGFLGCYDPLLLASFTCSYLVHSSQVKRPQSKFCQKNQKRLILFMEILNYLIGLIRFWWGVYLFHRLEGGLILPLHRIHCRLNARWWLHSQTLTATLARRVHVYNSQSKQSVDKWKQQQLTAVHNCPKPILLKMMKTKVSFNSDILHQGVGVYEGDLYMWRSMVLTLWRSTCILTDNRVLHRVPLTL